LTSFSLLTVYQSLSIFFLFVKVVKTLMFTLTMTTSASEKPGNVKSRLTGVFLLLLVFFLFFSQPKDKNRELM